MANFEGLLNICQNFEPTLAHVLIYFQILIIANGQKLKIQLAIWPD